VSGWDVNSNGRAVTGSVGGKKIAIKPIDSKNGIIYNFGMGTASAFYFLPK
jgi:hypothetical protein